jgi:hypothetical protein
MLPRIDTAQSVFCRSDLLVPVLSLSIQGNRSKAESTLGPLGRTIRERGPGRRKVTTRQKKAVPTPEDGRLTVCEVQQPRLDAMPLRAGFGRRFRNEDFVDDNRDVRQGAFAIKTAVGVSSVRAADQRLRYVNMINH